MKHKTHHLYYLFYPRIWIIIAMLFCNASMLAQEQTSTPNDFIIGTPIFHDLLTNPAIFNSFAATGMNTIHQRADDDTKPLLTNYNLVAYNTADSIEYIYHYSTSYYSKWEAEKNVESNRVGFKHRDIQGNVFGDTATWQGAKCWSTKGLSAPACSLMYGPHYRQEKRYKRWNYGCYNDSGCVTYTPRFKMALDYPSGLDSTEDVCIIKVVFRYKDTGPQNFHETIFKERTLKVGDFDSNGDFDDFYLHPNPFLRMYEYWPNFILPKYLGQMVDSESPVGYIDWEEYTGIQFCVEWLRTDTFCTLYIDYVEVYDNNGWNDFIDRPVQTANKIKDYADSFKTMGWTNIKYWGGTDEPYTIDSYMPIHIVDSLIRSVQAPPLVVNFQPSWWHTLNVNGEDEIAMFYNIAKPSKITLSVNPCYEEYPVIRAADLEWMRFNLQRTSALDSNFWFHIQAHGMRTQLPPIPPDAGWCVWRKPEPPELKSMVMLSLAHGAKGIIFLWFDSIQQRLERPNCTGVYMEAIVDENGVRIPDTSYSLYNTIKDNIVPRLKGKLGKTLMHLDYTGYYTNLYYKIPTDDPLPQPLTHEYLTVGCGGMPAEDMYWHFGFFNRPNYSEDKYFFTTNLMQWRDSNQVRVCVTPPSQGYSNYRFRNVEGYFDTTFTELLDYLLNLKKGEGYLYEVAPVIKFGGKLINSETISNETTLLDEMIIQNGATLTINSTYNADRDIRIKAGGRINTNSGGTLKFYGGHKLIIEGAATLEGTTLNKLTLDFDTPENGNGITIKAGGSLTISYCKVKNAVKGINSELNARYLSAQYVDFIDCDSLSVNIAGRSPGMDLTPQAQIKNCTMTNSRYGISITNLSGMLIQNNIITNTDLGIYLSNVTDVQIISNGIHSSKEELEGIISLSSGGVIRGNGITGHIVGIHLANSSPKLGGNRIYYNKYHGLYIGSGSEPNMRSEYAGKPPITYAISGYNEIKENGGWEEEGGNYENDGSEIYFHDSNALMVKGCNLIYDDREPEPPLINTLLLMNQADGHQIYVDARRNFWGSYISAERFGNLEVEYEPYNEVPCSEILSGAEDQLVRMTSFGEVIDTVYSTGAEVPELTETEEAYAEAEGYFLTGDLTNALQIYEGIINSNATEEEKYLSCERKYSIGRLTGQSNEFFNELSNTFSSLATNTQDTLNTKILNQYSTLSKVGEQEYETAIGEFDVVIQQNPNTEEAVYAEIDALTTALLIEEADSTLQKGRLGKYLVKTSGDYNQRADEILRKNFGGKSKETEKELLPTEYTLYQNYPNPFNSITTIKYDLPNTSEVSLIIYDILGRKIKELVNAKQQAGRYEVQFNASTLASGVYIYQLIAENPSTSSGQGFISSKKMILLK